jgi:hypothetical protein
MQHAGSRLTGSRSPAGPPPEPAHPEADRGTPQDLTLVIGATKPDQKSWDFDEDEQDFGEKKNLPKPHASP